MPVSTCSAAPPRQRLVATKRPTRQARSMLLITGRRWASAKAGAVPGMHPVEHVDVGVGRDRAQPSALGEVGDEEGRAAGLDELAGDRLEAAAVGVGLDHGGALDRDRHAGELLPVGLNGAQVDGQHAAGLARRAGRRRGAGAGSGRGRS